MIPKNHTCRHCGYVTDCVSYIMDEAVKPAPNDVNLCLKCGALYVFSEDLSLREPTLEELLKLKASDDWPEVERHRRAIEYIRKKHPWPSDPTP
jgi:hypothetical protein